MRQSLVFLYNNARKVFLIFKSERQKLLFKDNSTVSILIYPSLLRTSLSLTISRVKDERLIWISLFMKLTEYRFHREILDVNFLFRSFPFLLYFNFPNVTRPFTVPGKVTPKYKFYIRLPFYPRYFWKLTLMRLSLYFVRTSPQTCDNSSFITLNHLLPVFQGSVSIFLVKF